MFLSLIIPAYNEERRLPKTLKEIDEYLRRQPYDYEIIVVSDGSSDRTVEVGQNLTPEIKGLRVIDFKENHGKGYAVRQGMLLAKGDYRVFTDADNSTSINHLEKVLPELEKGSKIVIGTRDKRDHREALQAFPQAAWRRTLGDIFNIFVQVVLGLWGMWDTQCGFKGFSKEAVEKIFVKCRIDRFAFDPEIIVIARKLGYKIKVVPVYWINDPESKVNFQSMLKMGIDLLKIRWNMLNHRYDNDQTPISND